MITPTVVLQALVSGVLMVIGVGFTLVFGVVDVVNFAHGHLVMAAMFGRPGGRARLRGGGGQWRPAAAARIR